VSAAETSGADLLSLKTMAEQHRLSAVGAALSFDDLCRLRLPAILLRDRTVFAAVVGYEREGILIKGPLETPRVFKAEEFARRCGAMPVCLLVSRSEISARALGLSAERQDATGPRLCAGQSMVSLGRVSHPRWSGKVELVNVGTETLNLRAQGSCSCFQTDIGQSGLTPGESTTLMVTGVQESPGIISHEVSLSSGTDSNLLTVPIRGWLAPPVYFEEPVVVINPLRIGQVVTHDIPLIVPSGIRPESLSVDVSDSTAVSGSLILPPESDADSAVMLRVTVTGDAGNVGWRRERVSIRNLDDGADSISADLVVASHTVPALQVRPPELWIRERECGAAWRRRVTIRSDDGLVAPMKLQWSDKRCAEIADAKVDQVSPTEVQITLGGKAPNSAGLVGMRPLLIARFGDATVIEIPVQFGFPPSPAGDAETAIGPRASQEK
jgi:hypothetical protein